MSGYIKMYRSAFHTTELAEPDAFKFWFWLLANATHKPTRVYRGKGGRAVDLQPGQLVFAASTVPGMAEKRVRSLISRFERADMIQVQTRRDTGNITTITKWAEYQGVLGNADAAEEIQTAKQGRNKGEAKARQGRTAQDGLDVQNGIEESPSGDSSQEPQAALPLHLKPASLKERYPAPSKLPRGEGGQISFPSDFESAWQAYPVRKDSDQKKACYAHYRKAVVEERIPPERIREGAEAYAFIWAGKDYRWGMRRWLEERAWNNPVPKPSNERQSIAEQVREANDRDRRGEAWDPFGDIEESAYATGPEIEHRTLPEMPSDDADGRPQDATHGRGRHQGPDRALRTNVVPLLARGG